MPGRADSNRELDARLEAWVDGELCEVEAAKMRAAVADDPELARRARLAREVAGGLRELPALECPPRVLDSVMAQVRADAARREASAVPQDSSPRLGWWTTLLRSPAWQGGLVAGAAALLAAVLLWPSTPTGPSDAEIERAEMEVRLAFAYVSKMGSDAGLTVRDEMIANVVAPTRRALMGFPAGEESRR